VPSTANTGCGLGDGEKERYSVEKANKRGTDPLQKTGKNSLLLKSGTCERKERKVEEANASGKGHVLWWEAAEMVETMTLGRGRGRGAARKGGPGWEGGVSLDAVGMPLECLKTEGT